MTTLDTKTRTELMGKIVTVFQRYVQRFENGKNVWIPQDTPRRAGWVVGYRTLKDTKTGSHLFDNDEGYEMWDPFDYEVISTHPCVLVSYWHTDNPVRVPLDGFELGGIPHARLTWGNSYSEVYRKNVEYMRNAMKSWPRDEKGHWISWGKMTSEQRECIRNAQTEEGL